MLITSVCAGTLPNRSCLCICIRAGKRRGGEEKLETLAKRMERRGGGERGEEKMRKKRKDEEKARDQ